MNANTKYRAHCLICQSTDDLHIVVHYNNEGNMVGMIFCCIDHINTLRKTFVDVHTPMGISRHTFMNRSPYTTTDN